LGISFMNPLRGVAAPFLWVLRSEAYEALLRIY